MNSSASSPSRPPRAAGRCWARRWASCRRLCRITSFGLLHPFGDLDRFAANLIEVLDSPRYRENAERHRHEILESYDWRSISLQTEEIYHRAMTERR